MGAEWVSIIDHPLGYIVHKVWEEELDKRGYPKGTYTYSLPKEVYEEIATRIDRFAESFFSNSWDIPNLRNAWNYQARHLRKKP